MRVIVGLGAFLFGVCFMVFGPADIGDTPGMTGLILGAVLGSVVLAGRLIARRRKQATEPEQDTTKKD